MPQTSNFVDMEVDDTVTCDTDIEVNSPDHLEGMLFSKEIKTFLKIL